MACGSHPKGKLFWYYTKVAWGRETFSARDLEKLICGFDKVLNSKKSFNRLVMVNGISKKHQDIICVACQFVRMSCYCTLTPLISGFILNLRRRGSWVRTKMRGERGHPWPVPFDMEKAFDRWPLTWTFAIGVEFNARMEFSMQFGMPGALRASVM